MLVYEPCNYASNIAFYHSVTKICDYPDWQQDLSTVKDVKRAFAALGVGSAFMHASHTYVGHSFDNEMISVIAYQAHQIAIARIPSNSSVLVELSETPRKQTSKQIVNNITEMFYDQKVPIWAEVLETSDFPHDYELTFAALIATVVAMIFPWSMAEAFMTKLVDLAMKDKESRDFIINKYLPELHDGIKYLDVSLTNKYLIFKKFTGVLVKIMYAFAFQEHYLHIPGFKTETMIKWGGKHVHVINSLADSLTGFAQTDGNVNMSQNVYPGADICNYEQGHSIWHEVSANGLLDLVYFSDFINGLFK